jgi:hypothetical protein
LATKMTAKQWIELYEKSYVKPKTKWFSFGQRF